VTSNNLLNTQFRDTQSAMPNKPLHETLPAELILLIFSNFDPKTLCTIRLVCKFWKTQSDHQTLWKALTLKTFGPLSEQVNDWRKKFIELHQCQFAIEFVTFENRPPVKNKTLKVTMVGESNSGKTRFLIACSKKDYDIEYVPIVIDQIYFDITLKDTTVVLNIWDTPGQHEYDR
jgi:hypothetical protein